MDPDKLKLTDEEYSDPRLLVLDMSRKDRQQLATENEGAKPEEEE